MLLWCTDFFFRRSTNMYLKAIIFAAFLAGAPNAVESIVNGTQSSSGEFPYLVSIMYNLEHICGGFIYNYHYIVTAASCVYNKQPNQLKVAAGRYSYTGSNPGEEIYSVYSIVLYNPSYDPANATGDIALLELIRTINATNTIEFIPYDDVLYPDHSLSVMGWGAIEPDGNFASRPYKTDEIKLKNDCGANYVSRTMICAGDNETFSGPCDYDQGTPLVDVTENFAVGIVSQPGCSSTGYKSTIYTRLWGYYSWLTKTAGPQPPITATTTPAPTEAPTEPTVPTEPPTEPTARHL